MAIIPKSPFPNVPNLPGVPQVARSFQFPAAPPPILGTALAIGKLWQSIFTQPQWAIYKKLPPPKPAQPQRDSTGALIISINSNPTPKRVPVVVPDSFLEFSYKNKWNVSDFSVQQGAFASYNKVANPFEVTLRLAKGGSKEDRKKFLDSIDAIVGDLEFYDIITPEKSYLNVNIVDNEIVRRGPRGANFLAEVDIIFREIREVTATYSNTSVTTQDAQDPSAAPVTNAGSVQAQPTTTSIGPPP